VRDVAALKQARTSAKQANAKAASAKQKPAPRHVAFLRGINLGKRRPPMARLKALFEEMGFREVATFIASGNVIFSSALQNSRQLEAQISRDLEMALGYEVKAFVRRGEEVVAIGNKQPFDAAIEPGVTVHVCFLHEPLTKATARALEKLRTMHDEFRVIGREYYWLCRIKTNESAVWASPQMKALKLPDATMRNMTSVRKLIAKHLSD
jgi:uncharacterized protein (DUF1697 family)